MSTLADIESYLRAKNVNMLLKNILENICLDKPENPVQYIVDYLYRTHAEDLPARGAGNQPSKHLTFDLDDHNADDTDDEIDDNETGNEPVEPDPSVVSRRGSRRQGVSAEPLVPLDPTEMTRQNVTPKSEEEHQRINNAVGNNILFAHLDAEQKEELFNNMVDFAFKEGEYIMKQGDDGDYFYVIENGCCEIFVTPDGSLPTRDTSPVKVCNAGDSFGELALMYGTPRAATIQARAETQTWAIDRVSYRRILMDSAHTKRKLYERFLESVPILESLTRYERLTMADALEPAEYADGEQIVTQGERGDHFYVIEKGECAVSQLVESSGEQVVLATLQEGDYFGEIALLTNKPRAATVTAIGNVRCVRVDRKAFTRLLGPCESILRRNMQNYNMYMATKI